MISSDNDDTIDLGQSTPEQVDFVWNSVPILFNLCDLLRNSESTRKFLFTVSTEPDCCTSINIQSLHRKSHFNYLSSIKNKPCTSIIFWF